MFPLQTSIPVRNVPLITWTLIAINCMVFFFELSLPPEVRERMVYLFGIVPARYTHPEWAEYVGFPIDNYWPYLTTMFLHGGWLHLIGNMWTLFVFGRNIEDELGHGRYLVFYLLCGIAAGMVHTLLNAGSTMPAIGASGAIAGVMGAYLARFPHSRVVVMIPIFFFPFFFDFLAVFYLGFWFLLQLLSGTFSIAHSHSGGGIAFWAHVGGFVAGMALLPIFLPLRPRRRHHFPDEGGVENAWATYRSHARPRHSRRPPVGH